MKLLLVTLTFKELDSEQDNFTVAICTVLTVCRGK